MEEFIWQPHYVIIYCDVFQKPQVLSSKHFLYGAVIPISHLWRSLVWGPVILKGAIDLI